MKKVRLTRFTKVLLFVCLLATTIYNTPYNIHATEEEILTGEDNITEVVETPSEPQAPSESLEDSNTQEVTPEVEVAPEANDTPEVMEPVVSEQPAPVEPEVEPTPEVVPTVTPDEVIPSVEPTVVPSEQPVETIPSEVVPTETPVATQLPEETVVPTELPVETLLPELNEDDRLLSEEESMLFDFNSNNSVRSYPEYLTAKEAGSGNYTAPHDMDGHGGHINLVKTENGYKCLGDSTGEMINLEINIMLL